MKKMYILWIFMACWFVVGSYDFMCAYGDMIMVNGMVPAGAGTFGDTDLAGGFVTPQQEAGVFRVYIGDGTHEMLLEQVVITQGADIFEREIDPGFVISRQE